MESFEHLCKVALEAEGFAVTSNAKFPVRRQTKRTAYEEYQTHGYEIDLVGARGGQLILAEVKSFFGSAGVSRQGFVGLADERKRMHLDRYKLINSPDLRGEVLKLACERFGYLSKEVSWRMYVGKFASGQEGEIRNHLQSLKPPVEIVSLNQIVDTLILQAKRKTYFDDPVLMTVKAIMAANRLLGERPESVVLEANNDD